MGLITKRDCMSVTDLNPIGRDMSQIVDVCSTLHKDFYDYCHFNKFDQLVLGIVFGCF